MNQSVMLSFFHRVLLYYIKHELRCLVSYHMDGYGISVLSRLFIQFLSVLSGVYLQTSIVSALIRFFHQGCASAESTVGKDFHRFFFDPVFFKSRILFYHFLVDRFMP